MDQKLHLEKNPDRSKNMTSFFESIYYGSIENIVFLLPCPGKVLKYSRNNFSNIKTEDSVNASLENMKNMEKLGDEYKNIHCIGIPANNIDLLGSQDIWEYSTFCNSNFSIFERPYIRNFNFNDPEIKIENLCFIKISKEVITINNLTEQDYLVGFQSGKRSCIVKINDHFYRLKGCGNFNEGFPIQKMHFPKEALEVRGCQFSYSAVRESYMTDKINDIISKKYNLKTANIPSFIWEYGDIENKKLRLKNDLKKLKKYCSVYKVIAEKRLGCHLLPGIELILAEFIQNFLNESFKLQNIQDTTIKSTDNKITNDLVLEEYGNKVKSYEKDTLVLFNSKRIEKAFTRLNNDGNCEHKNRFFYNFEHQIVPTYEVVELIELNMENRENLNDLFNKYEVYKDISSGGALNELSMIIQHHKNNLLLSIFSPEKFNYNQSLKPENKDQDRFNYFNLEFLLERLPLTENKKEILNNEHFKYDLEVLKKSVSNRINNIFEFLKNKKMNFLEFISLIYQKVGYEAGYFKRILQDENINWGTYEDLPFRFHSNSHTDNFAIIPRNQGINRKNILSILDFDLAFFRDNFFNIFNIDDPEKFGKPDDNLYDFYINNERQVLEWEISGMENFISFDLLKTRFEKDEKFNFFYKSIIYLLRDTAVIGFRQGYLKN